MRMSAAAQAATNPLQKARKPKRTRKVTGQMSQISQNQKKSLKRARMKTQIRQKATRMEMKKMKKPHRMNLKQKTRPITATKQQLSMKMKTQVHTRIANP